MIVKIVAVVSIVSNVSKVSSLNKKKIQKKKKRKKKILSNIWQSAASPYIKEAQKVAKLLNKHLFFKSALLILMVSMNAFHSTNSFCCFSCCQAPTNSVALYFCI